MNKTEIARILAAELDRLAYLLDPFEYFDVVGRTGEETDAHIAAIAADLLSGNGRPYMEWLAEQSVDNCNSVKDRDRAFHCLGRLERFLQQIS